MASILLILSERLTKTERLASTPLGLLYLAAAVRDKEHNVDVLDLRVIRASDIRQTLDALLSKKFSVIGLSAISRQAATFKQVASYIKRKSPESLIIAGGPMATVNPEYCIHHAPIDLCVLGEGEETLTQLLEYLDAGKDIFNIMGIAYEKKSTGKIIKTSPRPFVLNLDELPDPAWDLIDLSVYSTFLSSDLRSGVRAEILTSRGCPYNCTFCQSILGKKFRPHSPDRVLQQMRYLYDFYDIRKFVIQDDTFNLDQKRAKMILSAINAQFPDVKLSFPCLRGDILDEEIITLLKDAGTDYIVVGVETASPRLQKLIKKNLNLPKLRENMKLIKKLGIWLGAYFIIGFPDETKDEIQKTFRLAKQLPIDMPLIQPLIPYEGTEIWKDLSEDMRKLISPEKLEINTLLNIRLFTFTYKELFSLIFYFTVPYLLYPKNWFIIYNDLRWQGFSGLSSRLLFYILPKGIQKKMHPMAKNQFIGMTDELSKT